MFALLRDTDVILSTLLCVFIRADLRETAVLLPYHLSTASIAEKQVIVFAGGGSYLPVVKKRSSCEAQ